QTTDSNGYYTFSVTVPAGIYRVVATQPVDLLDGKETAGGLGGTADNTQDSNLLSGIVLPAGSAHATGYDKKEADETFFVNLMGVTKASIPDGQGQGTILNDD